MTKTLIASLFLACLRFERVEKYVHMKIRHQSGCLDKLENENIPLILIVSVVALNGFIFSVVEKSSHYFSP